MPYRTVEYVEPNYTEIYDELVETLNDKDRVVIDLSEHAELNDRSVKKEMLNRGLVLSKVNRKPYLVVTYNR